MPLIQKLTKPFSWIFGLKPQAKYDYVIATKLTVRILESFGISRPAIWEVPPSHQVLFPHTCFGAWIGMFLAKDLRDSYLGPYSDRVRGSAPCGAVVGDCCNQVNQKPVQRVKRGKMLTRMDQFDFETLRVSQHLLQCFSQLSSDM
jgi:hypothetical protein